MTSFAAAAGEGVRIFTSYCRVGLLIVVFVPSSPAAAQPVQVENIRVQLFKKATERSRMTSSRTIPIVNNIGTHQANSVLISVVIRQPDCTTKGTALSSSTMRTRSLTYNGDSSAVWQDGSEPILLTITTARACASPRTRAGVRTEIIPFKCGE
jgi:hypothetical protein